MYPLLIKIGPLVIYSYGFFLVLAFLAATFLIFRKTKDDFNSEQLLDGVIVSLVIALLFGRIGFILIHINQLGDSFARLMGFIWFGGFDGWFTLLGGLVGYWLWLSSRRWDFFRFSDLAVSGALVGMMLVAIGDFLGGVSVGTPTAAGWGVVPAFGLQPRHPVALYQLAVLVVAWYLSLKLEQIRPFAEKPFTGFVTVVVVGFVFLGNFFVEFTRLDRLYFSVLTEGQFISWVLFVSSVWLFFVLSTKLRRKKGWVITIIKLLTSQVYSDILFFSRLLIPAKNWWAGLQKKVR